MSYNFCIEIQCFYLEEHERSHFAQCVSTNENASASIERPVKRNTSPADTPIMTIETEEQRSVSPKQTKRRKMETDASCKLVL